MESTTTDPTGTNALIACAGCKRKFPPGRLGRMARLPLTMASVFHMTPGNEGQRFYCPRCRDSQNYGMVTLVTFGFSTLVGYWKPMATGVVMLAWLAGSCFWLLFCLSRALHRRIVGQEIERHKS